MTTPVRRVRLATGADLDALVDVAVEADGLMTTMPRDRAAMAERLAEVDHSATKATTDGSEVYYFVLDEPGASGPAHGIRGLSAIYAAVGQDRPFFSYRLTRLSKYAPEIDRRFDYTILQPSNDYTGATEVGTLYLPADQRGGGRGRLLSLARFLFIVAHRARFGEVVMAEMRGWTDDAGRSPFWDAVGRKFFGLELDAADRLSGREFRFMQDLLPGTPIHVDLLPPEAVAVIGRPHRGSEPAAAMLARLGLRNHGYVDIFDAGLCLDAFIDDLSIHDDLDHPVVEVADECEPSTSEPATAEPPSIVALVASLALADFTVIETATGGTEPTITLTPDQAMALGVTTGDPVVRYTLPGPIDRTPSTTPAVGP